jgi:mannose-6-phosphate isomerase-like protein (cupin superfamily)
MPKRALTLAVMVVVLDIVGWTHVIRAFLRLRQLVGIHEWRGSGPAVLHVHHSDDEAWHILEGELTFRNTDRTETAGPGTTVFVPAGIAHTYNTGPGARYQADRDPAHQHEIYRQFDSELLESI